MKSFKSKLRIITLLLLIVGSATALYYLVHLNERRYYAKAYDAVMQYSASKCASKYSFSQCRNLSVDLTRSPANGGIGYVASVSNDDNSYQASMLVDFQGSDAVLSNYIETK